MIANIGCVILSLGLFLIVEADFGFAAGFIAFFASFAIQKALESLIASILRDRGVKL